MSKKPNKKKVQNQKIIHHLTKYLHAVKPPELMLFLHPGSWRFSLLQPLRRQPQHPGRRGFDRRRLPRHGRPRHGCRWCRRPRCGARAAQRATHGLQGLQGWWRLRSFGDDGDVRTTKGWRLIWHRIHTKTASQRLLTWIFFSLIDEANPSPLSKGCIFGKESRRTQFKGFQNNMSDVQRILRNKLETQDSLIHGQPQFWL